MQNHIRIIEDEHTHIFERIAHARTTKHIYYLLAICENEVNLVAYDPDHEQLAFEQFKQYLNLLGYEPKEIVSLKVTGGHTK